MSDTELLPESKREPEPVRRLEGPALKNLSRPKVEWGPIWSSAH